jgi:hypothetical protein
MQQYALLNKGSFIHSPCQLEWYKNDVNDRSILTPGGLQRIQPLDGYIIPLSIQDGLTHLKICPCTEQEFETLPHVILASKLEWDPSILDHEFREDEQWGEARLLILSSMKLVITNNVLYYTIHPISNVRMVLQRMISSISVFMLLIRPPKLLNMRSSSFIIHSRQKY